VPLQDAVESGLVANGGTYRWAAFSETGMRERNEDRWGHRQASGDMAVWVLADGMGGHDHGDLAAEIAVNAFLDAATSQAEPQAAARAGIAAARKAVEALRGKSDTTRAPSSTLVGLAVKGRVATVSHAGDSVLYQFRAGRLIYRTQDHNVREMKRAVNGSTPLPATRDADASQLTRSLGQPLDDGVYDTFNRLSVQPGDLILLCSDGVSNHIPFDNPGGWAAAIKDEAELIDRVRSCVLTANEPRQDNYTALAISVEGIGIAGIPSQLVRTVQALWLKRHWSPIAIGSVVSASLLVGFIGIWLRSPAAERPVEECETKQVTQEQCTTTFRKLHQCRRIFSGEVSQKELLTVQGPFTSKEAAETRCVDDVHQSALDGLLNLCGGPILEVQLHCTCYIGDQQLPGRSCTYAAKAQCSAGTEICEELSVPVKQCSSVETPETVCPSSRNEESVDERHTDR
jgi:PPM family protein phosphatase